MALPHATLAALAQQTATQLGFTLRRWWREHSEPGVLRVEVERRLVGAPAAIAVLTVAIPHSLAARPRSPARAAAPERSQPTNRPRRQTTATRPARTPRKSGSRPR